jgi:hypothetical protein
MDLGTEFFFSSFLSSFTFDSLFATVASSPVSDTIRSFLTLFCFLLLNLIVIILASFLQLEVDAHALSFLRFIYFLRCSLFPFHGLPPPATNCRMMTYHATGRGLGLSSPGILIFGRRKQNLRLHHQKTYTKFVWWWSLDFFALRQAGPRAHRTCLAPVLM